MHRLLPLANALQNVRSEVIVLHFLNALLDDFAQVVGFGAPRVGGKSVKSLLGFRIEVGMSEPPFKYLYSVYQETFSLLAS